MFPQELHQILGLTQLFLFLFFIMLGFPIAFTLMAMGIIFGYFGMGERVFDLLVVRAYAVMSNDVLLSVPLFVFMGYIIERANILDRLFRSLQMASGNIPGSLAVATLATCALFAHVAGYYHVKPRCCRSGCVRGLLWRELGVARDRPLWLVDFCVCFAAGGERSDAFSQSG